MKWHTRIIYAKTPQLKGPEQKRFLLAFRSREFGMIADSHGQSFGFDEHSLQARE
ncbi:MAG: hypothetical protein ACR2ON_04980 [Paracoccaceae bacterium]